MNIFWHFRITGKETSGCGHKKSWTTMENRLHNECKRTLVRNFEFNYVSAWLRLCNLGKLP